MAAMFLARRLAINNISKASSKDHSLYIQSSSRISSIYFFSSSPMAKGVNVTTKSSDEAMRQGLNEAKQQALDVEEAVEATEGSASGATGYAGDEGLVKAVEVATPETKMDDAANRQRIRDVTEGGLNDFNDTVVEDNDFGYIETDEVVDEMQDFKDPVDTVEYRSIEEQRNK